MVEDGDAAAAEEGEDVAFAGVDEFVDDDGVVFVAEEEGGGAVIVLEEDLAGVALAVLVEVELAGGEGGLGEED